MQAYKVYLFFSCCFSVLASISNTRVVCVELTHNTVSVLIIAKSTMERASLSDDVTQRCVFDSHGGQRHRKTGFITSNNKKRS